MANEVAGQADAFQIFGYIVGVSGGSVYLEDYGVSVFGVGYGKGVSKIYFNAIPDANEFIGISGDRTDKVSHRNVYLGPEETISWDPLTKGINITLSNGNLTASGGSTTEDYAFITIPHSSGKYYWEARLDSVDFSVNAPAIGVANKSTYNNLFPAGGPVGTWNVYWSNSGQLWITDNGIFVSAFQANTFVATDIINFAVDLDSGKMYVGKNGIWINSGNPDAGTGAVITDITTATNIHCFVWCRGTTATTTARWKTTDWTYSRPQASTFNEW